MNRSANTKSTSSLEKVFYLPSQGQLGASSIEKSKHTLRASIASYELEAPLISVKQDSLGATDTETTNKTSSFTESISLRRYLTRKELEPKEQELAKIRQELALKKFNGGLTSKEERNFKYLSWQLQRLHDAQIGDNLDRLEQFILAAEANSDSLREQIRVMNPKQATRSRKKS
jgi:hypothetical protein